MNQYIPPWLHRGGHLQSILSAKCSYAPYPAWQRERWEWGDGDFCDADWLNQTDSKAKTLVLFHGLEGSSRSHYARSVGAYFHSQGWRVVVPHFRGCSGEPNRLLRAYHSGDAAEIERMLDRVHQAFAQAPLYTAGVSLGGNAMLTFLATSVSNLPLQAAAAVCAPLDLARCQEAITSGFSTIYTLMFMQTLRAKALLKRQRFPHACDWQGVIRSKNLYEFDDVFTAPVHGYKNTHDYYARASAKPMLQAICTPTLLLNSLNDPFVPVDIVVTLNVSKHVTINQPAQGGHVGFAQGVGLGQLNWLPQRLHRWFEKGV
jgi:uncharacterized protein